MSGSLRYFVTHDWWVHAVAVVLLVLILWWGKRVCEAYEAEE